MKDLKISNILLTEILKSPVEIISIDEYKCMIRNSTYFDNEQMGIVYRYLYGNEEIRFMSIYEFAFKCKEWAYIKGFKLLDECNAIIITSLVDRELHIVDNDFKLPYKIERIIKACNWILEKLNEKI